MPGEPARWHPDGLAAAKAAAIPDCCLFCRAQLPDPASTPRARLVCDSPSCKTAYMRAWRRDQRAGAPKLYTPPGWRLRWHCGCGRSYCAEYFRRRHHSRCLFARDAWPVVVVPARRAA